MDILPKKTPGRVEIDPTAIEDALPGAAAADAVPGGGGGADAGLGGMAEFLSPFEAEHYVEELRAFGLEDVGGKKWMQQHERLERLNFQAHQSAKARADEYILEACLTFDKLETLVHDLLLIEAWKAEVFPKLLEGGGGGGGRVPEKASSKVYFVLYHEATVLNLLEVFLFHEHACEALGDALLELIDYCMRKVVRLHCRPRDGPGSVRELFFEPAKELGRRLDTESVADGLRRHAAKIDFSVGVTTASVMRCICGHASKEAMPVGTLSRLLDTHDCVVALVPLIEYPPWTHRDEAGQWFKYVEQKWEKVAPEDLLKITKTEGQLWLALFHLMCDGECRKRYVFNGFRKEQVLRVRKYLNDVMLDQLPVLADVQRYMDELAIMQAPSSAEAANSGKSALLMEAVPVLRTRVLGGRGDAAFGALADAMLAPGGALDEAVAVGEMKQLSALYAMDGVEDLMDGGAGGGAGGVGGTLEERHAQLVNVTVTVVGADGNPVPGVGEANYKWDGQDEVRSSPGGEGGDEWARRKVVRVTSEGLDWADEGDLGAPVPFDARLRARVIFASGHVAELESEPLGLPTRRYACRSPAEAAGRVAIPVPADPPAAPPAAGEQAAAPEAAPPEEALPPAQWRQLGSLQTTETVVQAQLRRLDRTSGFCKDPSGQPQAVLLHCYALGTLFVSSKMRDAAAAAAEPGAAGTDRIIQQLTREMAAAKAADEGEAD